MKCDADGTCSVPFETCRADVGDETKAYVRNVWVTGLVEGAMSVRR